MSKNKRHLVIDLSVMLESAVSNTLCLLLDINKESSKAFGTSSQSLSFSNRLTILGDINAIDKKEKVKFEYFSAIRNQFAHNVDAIDFTSCFSFIDMENNLKKLYPIEKNPDKEVFCENLFNELYVDLLTVYEKVVKSLKEKSFDKGVANANQELFNVLIETLQDYAKNDPNLYDQMAEIFKITADKASLKLNESHK